MAFNRRWFLKRAFAVGLGGLTSAGVYPFLEAKWCRIVRQTITLPNLPHTFRGMNLALLTDIHHGPYVPLEYIRHVVATTNALQPDLILLGGDYVSQSHRFIAPGIDALRDLEAPMGRFAVLGNHDHWESSELCHDALDDAGITRIDNTGVWLDRGGSRLRICGVGDLWRDHQDVIAALGGARGDDSVVMLSHNPDFAELLRDHRVGLMLSGHTHGGQIFVPGYGAPVVPSRYGQKYLGGLIQGPVCQVFVSRGVGTTGPPVRLSSRPEIVLITLM